MCRNMTERGEITTFATLNVSNSCQNEVEDVEKSFCVCFGDGGFGCGAGGFHAGGSSCL